MPPPSSEEASATAPRSPAADHQPAAAGCHRLQPPRASMHPRGSSSSSSSSSSSNALRAWAALLLAVLMSTCVQAFVPGGLVSMRRRGRIPDGHGGVVLTMTAGGEQQQHQQHEMGNGRGDGASGGQSTGTRRHQQLGITSRGGLVRGLAAVGMAALTGALGEPPQGARAAEGSLKDEDLPPVAFKTKSGLRYYDVRKGEGPAPKWGQVAIIQYEGYVRASPFSRLVLFDDTYSRRTPYLVKHGNGRVIRGLDEGLHTMRLGGLRRIVVPLELGYTKTGLGPIPPNALRRKVLVRELSKAEQQEGEIVYDVELVSLYDDEADLGYYDDLTFDPGYLQDGLEKAVATLQEKGIKVPSAKTFMTKPEILGQRRREADVDALPDLL